MFAIVGKATGQSIGLSTIRCCWRWLASPNWWTNWRSFDSRLQDDCPSSCPLRPKADWNLFWPDAVPTSSTERCHGYWRASNSGSVPASAAWPGINCVCSLHSPTDATFLKIADCACWLQWQGFHLLFILFLRILKSDFTVRDACGSKFGWSRWWGDTKSDQMSPV